MRIDRYAPLAGVVAVVLWLVGTYLLEKDDRPGGKDTDAFVAWVEANDSSILAGAIVFGFGVLFFVWLLGSLRHALLAAEGGTGRMTAVAFASGIAVSISLMFGYLPHAQAAFDHENISDTGIDALVHVGDAFFGGAVLFSIPFLVATGVVALRHAALPRWFGWVSVGLAVVLALPTLGFLGLVAGLPLWTLAASLLLYRQTP